MVVVVVVEVAVVVVVTAGDVDVVDDWGAEDPGAEDPGVADVGGVDVVLGATLEGATVVGRPVRNVVDTPGGNGGAVELINGAADVATVDAVLAGAARTVTPTTAVGAGVLVLGSGTALPTVATGTTVGAVATVGCS